MRIDLITPYSHPTRVVPWFDKAANDPKVHRWYASSAITEVPPVLQDDWAAAHYMDENNVGLLSITHQRNDKLVSVSLYVLDADAQVAAAMMRFFISVLVPRYSAKWIAFAIAETNTVWVQSMLEIAGEFRWGVEPSAIFDPVVGETVNTHRFKIPIPNGSKDCRRLLRRHIQTKRTGSRTETQSQREES